MNEMGICWVGVKVDELMDTNMMDTDRMDTDRMGKRIPDSKSAPAFKRTMSSPDLDWNAEGHRPILAL